MKQEQLQAARFTQQRSGHRPRRCASCHIQPTGVAGTVRSSRGAARSGFLWLACTAAFQEQLPTLQAALQQLAGMQLVDLHVSDLLNAQLPSRYDYTSQYDLLVFRRTRHTT